MESLKPKLTLMGFAVLECSALRLTIHSSVILCYGINKCPTSDLNYNLIHPETNRALLIYPSWAQRLLMLCAEVVGCHSNHPSTPPPHHPPISARGWPHCCCCCNYSRCSESFGAKSGLWYLFCEVMSAKGLAGLESKSLNLGINVKGWAEIWQWLKDRTPTKNAELNVSCKLSVCVQPQHSLNLGHI